MSLSLSDFFILASVLQGLFLGVAILFAPFFRSKANTYLGLSVTLMSLITFLGWQNLDIFWIDYVWSLMLEFLFPALLLLYFLHVLDHHYLKAKWLPLVYAPFVFFLLVDIFVDLDFVFNVYKLPIEEEGPAFQFFDGLEDSLSLWFNIFIMAWMFRLARADTKLNPLKRQWLLRFSVAMMGVLVVWFLSDLVQAKTGIEDPYAAIWIAMALLFWWIAYAGVYQLHILDERAEIHALLNENKPSFQPTSSPTTAPVTANMSYAPALERLMREEELFRNPNLGRQMVADKLGISEGYVSEIMQDSVGQGFVEYVNSYRIRAAKLMLEDEAFVPYSLHAIGQEAGFRSRSSFYETFKKATGLTPGAYRKQLEPS
jgi:AraC-like DNA-binding protein